MFPFGTVGKTDASTTRRPSTPWTRIEPGSTTLPIAHVHDGCSAVSASRRWQCRPRAARDPVQDLLVRLDLRPRRELAALERLERRLPQNAPRDADRLDPFAAVLLRGQVVEPQRRMRPRVGARDLHR